MKNICRNKNKEGFDYEEKGIIHDAGWRNDRQVISIKLSHEKEVLLLPNFII